MIARKLFALHSKTGNKDIDSGMQRSSEHLKVYIYKLMGHTCCRDSVQEGEITRNIETLWLME